MKNSIFVLMVMALFLASCSSTGEKAKTGDAQEVVTKNNAQSKTLSYVSPDSHVKWKAAHLGGVQPRFGKVKLKSAQIQVNGSVIENATITLDMTAFTVENFPEGSDQIGKLAGHLKSPDFFDVQKFPTSKFELVSLQKASGKFNSNITGNLTIKGVSKSITFKANVSTSATSVTIKSEDFSVDRTLWGLVYNVEGTVGVPADYLIANDIGFTIDVTVK